MLLTRKKTRRTSSTSKPSDMQSTITPSKATELLISCGDARPLRDHLERLKLLRAAGETMLTPSERIEGLLTFILAAKTCLPRAKIDISGHSSSIHRATVRGA